MRIGLLAVDSDYPNIALMKISTYHKSIGDDVEWYNPLSHYDKAYFSRIFTFTPDYGYYVNADKVEKGGTGYNICKVLPEYIDKIYPDYGLYPPIDKNTAYGFLTRGCPNRCPWCIVPDKEGNIKPYMDVEEVAKDRKNLMLMDNNILACDYGIGQIEKIIKNKYRVDFNQGLDARLVTDDIAKLLSKVRWIKRVRFGCDTPGQINDVKKAVSSLDKHGYKGEIFLYRVIRNLRETYDRIMAQKYAENSWQDLPDGFRRFKSAMLRHLVAFEKGEITDPESGLPRLAHMEWNALAVLYSGTIKQQQHDQPTNKSKKPRR